MSRVKYSDEFKAQVVREVACEGADDRVGRGLL